MITKETILKLLDKYNDDENIVELRDFILDEVAAVGGMANPNYLSYQFWEDINTGEVDFIYQRTGDLMAPDYMKTHVKLVEYKPWYDYFREEDLLTQHEMDVRARYNEWFGEKEGGQYLEVSDFIERMIPKGGETEAERENAVFYDELYDELYDKVKEELIEYLEILCEEGKE